MAGTPEGARKALETKRKRYGQDAPKKWGKKGGEARNESPNKFSPFEGNSDFAREMAKIGSAARWKKDPTKAVELKPRDIKKIKPKKPVLPKSRSNRGQ